MAAKNKTAKGKARTLATKTLSRKHAGEIRGGFMSKGVHYDNVTIEMGKAGGDPVKN